MAIKRLFNFFFIVFVCCCAIALEQFSQAAAMEITGFVGVEGRLFFEEPLYEGQKEQNGSIVLQPEFYHEWESGSSFTFVPFARLDSGDDERSHADIRELQFLYLADTWEFRLGISKVFWGVTEFIHLVDIINQTDLVEDIDEEDKLGQPMLHLSVPRDWGTVDAFLLPYFRERLFPGGKDRLRTPFIVDIDHPVYVSSSAENHTDFAVRYSHFLGDMDFGLYYFQGTGRAPTLMPMVDEFGRISLVPLYEQIRQFGIDSQMVAGEWLWKLETIHRSGQKESFFAATGGFEYTIVGVAGTIMDLGLLTECAFDDRREKATTFAENDIMLGTRLAVNDQASSELLAGVIQDLDSHTRLVSVEANRRIGDNMKLSADVRLFLDTDDGELIHSFRNDDFVRVELNYYF